MPASVFIADALSEAAIRVFEDKGIKVNVKTGLGEEDLIQELQGFDGLAVRSATKATAKLIEATNLKVIGRAGIGVDNIDRTAATLKGIVVMNTPYGNSVTTAEHSLAMMMALARHIPQASHSTHLGKWEKSKFMGVELCDKTLGIIGCGNIGSIVANRALGLGMNVAIYDPFLTAEKALELGVEKVELDHLFAHADFITLHTPLTEQTKGILNKDSFQKMKKGVRIVNCARGGLVVEQDLLAALEAGIVAGAALDVFEVEPAKENILFGRDDVILTPHLGASTEEAQEKVAVQVAEQMADYLLEGAIKHAVNVPSLNAEEAQKLAPYLKLVNQLGQLAAQLADGAIQKIDVSFLGLASKLNSKPLLMQVVEGILKPTLDCVNTINALHLASERNIQVAEVKSEHADDYHLLIKVKIITDTTQVSVSGTIFTNAKSRIVEVKAIPLEAELTRDMLFVINQDKPGFIGDVGRILGENNINIATFHLGREKEREKAVALISLDQEPSDKVMQEITNLNQVIEVKKLCFK